MDALAGEGVEAAGSPAEVADRAEIVLVSLPTPEVVRAVALGPDGLIHGGAIRTYVDLSTTGQAVAAEVAAALAERGITTLDAPVSGGVRGAVAGHARGHGRRAGARARARAAAARGVRPRVPRRRAARASAS